MAIKIPAIFRLRGVFYPLGSQDFVRTGFLRICPTLSARDYKDAKCVMVRNEKGNSSKQR